MVQGGSIMYLKTLIFKCMTTSMNLKKVKRSIIIWDWWSSFIVWYFSRDIVVHQFFKKMYIKTNLHIRRGNHKWTTDANQILVSCFPKWEMSFMSNAALARRIYTCINRGLFFSLSGMKIYTLSTSKHFYRIVGVRHVIFENIHRWGRAHSFTIKMWGEQ
jgi:hypothetical protein